MSPQLFDLLVNVSAPIAALQDTTDQLWTLWLLALVPPDKRRRCQPLAAAAAVAQTSFALYADCSVRDPGGCWGWVTRTLLPWQWVSRHN